MILRIVLIFLGLLFYFNSVSQVGRVEQRERAQQLIDRYEIKYGHYEGFMGLSPKSRSEIRDYFFLLDSVGLSEQEMYDRQIILDDMAEFQVPIESDSKSWWKHFYENKSHFYSVKKKDFWFSANPISFLKAGLDNSNEIVLQNTRAARIKGALGSNMYFSASIYENQASFQSYHEKTINRFQTIPGQAFYKDFDFGIENSAFDYLNGDGFVGMSLNKFTNVEFGHGRQFIGHGMRSLLLSDFATNYLYLRANTKFWKFNYQNLFTELTPFTEKLVAGDVPLPKKYMAQHLLSFKPNHRWELAVFETVVFSRENQFELQYLNPIMLYRTVEQFLNSPDNVILGAQAKWNPINGYQLYGQLIVDEFNLGALREDIAWWGNKFGAQIGLKAIDFLGIQFLDLQGELNAVRPYTYTHRRSFDDYEISKANYSHFSQPLAHPLGANFYEMMWDLRYRFGNRWFIHPRVLLSAQGVDGDGPNIGANILLDNQTRAGTDNQRFLQGNRVNTQLYAFNLSCEVFRHSFVDLNIQYRNAVSTVESYDDRSFYIGLGIRMNYYEAYQDY